jgi:hypothetical protein
MVSICARACATVRPSARRPFTKSQRWPRFWMRVAPGVVVRLALDALEVEAIDHHHRRPELRFEPGHHAREAAGGDTHDGVLQAAELDGLAEDVGASAEAALPQAMTEHDDRVLAFSGVLVLPEAAAEGGTHAQDVEVVRRDGLARDQDGRAAGGEDAANEGVGGHAAQRVGPSRMER